MSMSQYEWLERKGVADAWQYNYAGQDDCYVYVKRSDIGLVIKRKKDIVGWKF